MATATFDLKVSAERLARANMDAEPNIQEVYWFPANDAIHLIEIDPTTVANDEITPFYFGPDPASDIFFPSGIALIRPDEKEKLSPPSNWGSWSQAVKLLSRN